MEGLTPHVSVLQICSKTEILKKAFRILSK